MRQVIKTILLAGVAAFGLLQSAQAYSLAGPVGHGGDAWQVITIGYGPPVDFYAPKNLGEEYRRNTPVMYYAFDASFFDYFGPQGASSVEGAFTILNALTNVDDYSKQISEFPLETRHQNYQAQALGLIDLKSYTLGLMMSELGLEDPIHYAWTLHNRYLPSGGACPIDEEYSVIQRNFDYVSSPLNQLQYSPYVNNTLYSYQIIELCQNNPWLAMSVPFSVDPLADVYSPVASAAIGWGDYYTGLTRDDVAGLRYLMQTNNINWESVSPDSTLFTITTNFNTEQSFPPYGAVISTTNGAGLYYFMGSTNFNSGTNLVSGTNAGFGYGELAPFLGFISTNDPATVQAAYPGVVISSVTNNLVLSSNISSYTYSYNVPYGAPYGSPPVLTVTTNYTLYWQAHYYYQFANVFTNHIYTNTAQLVTAYVGPPIGSPYGTAAITNTTVILTNQVDGDFFVLPQFYTNVCPLDIVASLSNVVTSTNYFTSVNTNIPAATNLVTSTNIVNVSNSVYLVTYFTNYSYAIYPVTCSQVANATGLYQGVGKVRFVRANYDSLLGQYFQPITNYYSMMMVTNSQIVVQHFGRVVTGPDFLFSASDQTPGPASQLFQGSVKITHSAGVTDPPFDENNVYTNLAGPGTIIPSTRISFNKDGPLFFNTPLDTMDGTTYFTQNPGGDTTNSFYIFYFIWGSFDGTTNVPVVFPNGTSIDDSGSMVTVHISPSTLPSGFNGVPYPSVTFTATGGSFTQPFTWSATGLPDGLTLSSGGTLSGTPTQAGTFAINLTLTDYLGRTAQWVFPFTIQ